MNPLRQKDPHNSIDQNTAPIAHSKKTGSSPKLLNKVLSVIKNIEGNFRTMALSFKAKSQHNTYEEVVLASYKGQAQKMREPFQHKYITAFQKSILNDINNPKGIKFKQTEVSIFRNELKRIQQEINKSETAIQMQEHIVSGLYKKLEELTKQRNNLSNNNSKMELIMQDIFDVLDEITSEKEILKPTFLD